MLPIRYLVLLLLISASTYAQNLPDTILASQYYQAADSLSKLGEYSEANSLFRKAQQIYHATEDWEKYISCLNSIGYNLWPVAAYDSATILAQQALGLSEEHLGAEHPEAARAYDILGIVQEYRGKLHSAVDYYTKSLKIREKHFSENHPYIADSYENLGIAFYQMSDYPKALNYHKRALDIRLKVIPNDSLSLAYAYNNLGSVYRKQGLYKQALSHYQEALNIRLRVLDERHPDIAISYNNIGQLYRQLDAYDQALAYHQKALDINHSLFGEYHREVAVNYNALGSLYTKKKNYKKAIIHYQKGLSVLSKLFGKTHPSVAISYNNLGTAHLEEEAYDSALFCFQKSLSINRDLFGEIHREVGINYVGLGVLFERQDTYQQALGYYQKALTVERKLYGKTHPRIADSYNRIGKMYHLNGSYDDALEYYQKSIVANGISSVTHLYSKSRIANYLDGKILLLTLHRMALVLAKLNRDALSLSTYQLADRLVNQLRHSYQRQNDKSTLTRIASYIYEGALQTGYHNYQTNNSSKLLDTLFYLSERSKANLLIGAISHLEAQRFGRVPDTLLNQEAYLRSQQAFFQSQLVNAPDSSLIQNKLFSVNRQYDSLILMLEKQYPDYYQLKYDTRTATVSDIQTQLTSDEAVLSYFVGDSTYYTFAITPEHFRIVPLPVGTLLSDQINLLRQALSSDSIALSKYKQTTYALYQQLLAPVLTDSTFTKVKSLTIIPDGTLGYLPFELLLTEPSESETNYAYLPYLLRDYTVRYGYSATWLFRPFSRSEIPTTNHYIAFAPHYPAMVSDSVQQLSFGRFRNQVAPLRWNQQEVEDIGEHLSGVSYTQATAVERRFKEEADQYRIIHLAMHALVDDQNPMNSRLVFSQDPTDTSEDGYLNAYEIYNMEIPAELAVLSACETGYGKLERGEGIMSLARAFAYAGCPSIVMSHWLVDDRASAKLMNYFYQYLSEGLPKDEALRQTKLIYLESAPVQKTHPFFWSNFVLIGDTAPIVNNRPIISAKYISIVIVGCIILFSLAFLLIKRPRHYQ